MASMKVDSEALEKAMWDVFARHRSLFLSPGQVARIARVEQRSRSEGAAARIAGK